MSPFTSRLGSIDWRLPALIGGGLVVLLTLATAGAAYAYQEMRPTDAAFNLRPGQTEVPLDQRLTISFSRPVAAGSLSGHLHIAPAVEGHLEPAAGGRSFTWLPDGPLADLTPYSVVIDGFRDRGHDVRGARLAFTTTLVPRVTAVTTEAGSGVADGADLPIGTRLTLAFNAAMDQAATHLLANGAPATVVWAADGRSAGLDTGGLPVGPLELALGPGGRDMRGHAIRAGWKLGLNLAFRVNVHTTPLKYPALVQIPNDPSARDQSGLQSADMVFEYATEGGIPRFTAIFTNIPDKVGPVRSGRLISIRLTRNYHGELFLSGTSQGAFAVLRQSGIPAVFDSPGVYYRSYDRPAPNNLYINGDAIARAEGQSGVTPFKPVTGRPSLAGGAPAAQVQVTQSGSTYAYDDRTRTYTKSQDGHTLADASISQPLRIAMVVVMHARSWATGIVEDSNGAHGLDYDLDAGGPAEVYWTGMSARAHWSCPGGGPLALTLESGQAIALPAGLVWVDVVP